MSNQIEKTVNFLLRDSSKCKYYIHRSVIILNTVVNIVKRVIHLRPILLSIYIFFITLLILINIIIQFSIFYLYYLAYNI